jgi:uncharacterized protein (DUF2141 family)
MYSYRQAGGPRVRIGGALQAASLLASSLLLLSCSPSSPSDPGQTQGRIEVTVSSSGTGVPASYTVRLNGGTAKSVASDGSVSFEALSPGNYEVELSVADNCTVSGSATRTVGVQESSTSTVSFTVTCTAVPIGAIGVTTTSSGAPADPDGYAVSVDGGAGQALGVNGTLLIPDLTVGDHQVELGGIADNCMAQGDNPRLVPVDEDQTTQVEFEVICSATTGLIDVTVTTTGGQLDPDGYTVDLDGAATQAVETNGSTLFTGVEEGPHTLALGGVATNCLVTSNNPVSADVVAGQTTDVGFSVSCTATTGGLQVSANTTGSEIDPDGYLVSVDEGAEQPIVVNGTVNYPALVPGGHDVELTGVAANCAVAGSNPRTVEVVAGETASTTFDVTCSSTVGAVEVTVSTTGEDIDSDGYTVDLDGTSSRSVAANGMTVFTGIAPGNHTLTLQNIEANCDVTSSNPTSASVTPGDTAAVSFDVLCQGLTGDLEVTTSTTGQELDNGYAVVIDGGAPQPIGINATAMFEDLDDGDHSVLLTDVAANCIVSGSNPRTVTVPVDGTGSTTFNVSCAATTGTVQVSVSTSGEDIPTGDYTVALEDQGSLSVAVNGGTATFTEVPPGTHDVTLSGFPGNCTVDGENPEEVTVTAGNTSNVSFAVTCEGLTGDLRVITETMGLDLPEGYEVVIDGVTSQPIGVNDTVTFMALDDGDHEVDLSDVAPNCAVSGANPRTVSVPANGTGSTTFEVVCILALGSIEVTTMTTIAVLPPGAYMVDVDGVEPTPIDPNAMVTFTEVPAGPHTVTLSLAVLDEIVCDVTSANPVVAQVFHDETAGVGFEVNCL